MGRKKKPSGRLNKGPFGTRDVERALKADGWFAEGGGGHQTVFRHAKKPGKIPVSQAWTGLRAWDPILTGIAETSGLGKRRLLQLLNS